MNLPPEFAHRERLANELHARPFESVTTPGAVLSVATLRSGSAEDAACLAHLALLQPGAAPEIATTATAATHLSLRCGAVRVRWERHTEFYSFTFISNAGPTELAGCFDTQWLDTLPAGWLAALPGPMIAATQIALLPCPGEPPHVRSVAPLFGSEVLVGNRVADGAATVVTDLRSVQGVTRFLVFDHTLNRRRAGRTAQRLIELDTYRMMALLSLPVASKRMSELAAEEEQLASLMDRFRAASDGDETLLAELTDLAARVEHAMANHGSRFSATQAYRGIVDRRLAELREQPAPGLQPLSEFLDRRFRPAMESCAAASARQAQLSERIARAAQLLQTRAEVERERQNQALLASMDRRAGFQLRLQQTVEGLSVIAMTYYGVGLGAYLFKPLAKAAGINEGLVTMIAVPVIGLVVLLNVRRVRRKLVREHTSG